MMKEFDRLLETDGDEQSNDDGRYVNEEVLPCVDGFVGSVDFEHGCSAFLAGRRRFSVQQSCRWMSG
jgi:hypothetical protein